MSATPVLDVLVIGSGITGLSTLVHLKARGISRVALATDPTAPPASSRAPGLLMGGQLDNFTRLSHRHGLAVGKALWAFGDSAFDAFVAYARQESVPVTVGPRLRLITSAAELREAEQAVQELRDAGFQSVKLTPPESAFGGRGAYGDRVLAVQEDGPRGGLIDVAALTSGLAKATAWAPRVGPVSRVARDGSNFVVDFVGGSSTRAEFVVLAAHLGIKTLLPELSDALVPFADQWGTWARSESAFGASQLPPGTVITATHANEWGAVAAHHVTYGGARYLRPLGGMEATSAVAEERITKHLGNLASQTLPPVRGEALATGAGLDIRPCDELPVIGPMFGESRVLVGAGYMGLGLTLGFHAGACMAELIAKGVAPGLPRILWPERLRSLEA